MWSTPACQLGGDRSTTRASEAELRTRYAEPHRHYHNLEHIHAVIRDSTLLAQDLGLSEVDRCLLTLAAAAHDVVYNGQPGQDERDSATWARTHLLRAGLPEPHATRVEALILATATHTAPPGDLLAATLLDADLAILATDPTTYDRYRHAVRKEYAHLDAPTWRTGRTTVMRNLLTRQPLYTTPAAQTRWEANAKANLTRELRDLGQA
jgi:predicted metal-dependent HD superfamily phosphohydrolase